MHFIQHLGLVISLSLIISVHGNNTPKLSISESFVDILEDASNGTYIATLTARDSDPDEVLTVTLVGDTDTLVKLSLPSGRPDTGVSYNITLASKLDRDYAPAVRQLYFEVRDKDDNRKTLRSELIIKDVNDEPPTFANLPYRFSVYENETIGTTLFSVSTTDPDDGLGGIATYWLEDSSNLGNPFTLSGSSIILSTPVNYSINTFYQFKVHAKDNMVPFNEADPVVDLVVNVLDVQNMPPYFLHQPYTASILENTTIGSSTKLTVVALDGDRGVPNGIVYSFVQGEEHNFTINSTTGEVSVAGGLDADDEAVKQKGGVFRITVNASEVIPNGQTNHGRTWSTTDLSITLIDVNDNKPTFTEALYTASIAENSPKGVPLTMVDGKLIEVSDSDQTPEHHSFELLMSGDNSYPDAFDTIPGTGTPIYSKSTVILKVNNTQILDYETRTEITFKLRAKELNSDHETETTIVVQILDVNDNSPVFTNHSTQFSVHENTPPGTFIGLMTATDKESAVTYTLEDEDDKFQIDSDTGNLTVKGDLDREVRSSYTVFVVATDQDSDPSQQRSTRLRINIDILDINDNHPEFIDIPTRRQIPEDTKTGTELFKISAIDKDNGTNQEIEYFLTTNGNITGLDIDIDDGAVFVNQSLIGMVGLRYITVMARDKGTPSLNATVQILIIITDVNLHRPVFYKPSYSEYNVSANLIPEVSVKEEQTSGSEIFTFCANDSDSGENGAILYRLVPDTSNDWQSFAIDRLSGVLTNDGRLDREKQEIYQISITAVDGGLPSLESTIKLKIVLEDIDDNPPVFGDDVHQPHSISVPEEQTDIVVGNIALATDPDKISIICYYILGGELIDHFVLNKTSGVLSLVKSLDREERPEVNLVIVASGDCSRTIQTSTREELINGHPPDYDRDNNTMLWVRITVTDVNDHPPLFSSKEITSGFLYDIEFGSIIQNLKDEVTDADIGENATTYFKLLEPIKTKDIDIVIDPNNPPLILDINGTIKTNMLFSSDMTGAFIMNVQAYDIGNLSDEAVIEIYLISDIQRVKMVFLKTPDEVRAVKDELIKDLEKVLEYRIIVDKIATHQSSDGSPVITKSDMFIHARYLDTDKVVPAAELWRAFDFSQNMNLVLDKYGVIQTSPVIAEKKEETTTEDTLRLTLIIVTISLGVIAFVLVLFLISLRSRYRRKLRAATTKTFGSAKETIPDLIPPGTNKYFAAASNPVYMKEVNLNLTEDDTTSQNSLDVNEVDDKKKLEMTFEPEEQEVVMSLYDERAQVLKDSNRNPALDMVLQQYEEVLNLQSREIMVENGGEGLDGSVSLDDLEHTDI